MGARAPERPLLPGHRHLSCWSAGTHAPSAGAQSLPGVQPAGRGSPGRMEEAGLPKTIRWSSRPLEAEWPGGPWDRTGRQGGHRAHCIPAGSVSGSLFSEKPRQEETGGALGTHQDPKWSGLAPLPGSHLGSPGRWVARWLRVPDTQRDGRPGPQGPTGAAPCRARETSPFRASSEEAPGGRGLSGHWGAEWPGPARTPVCSSPGKAGDWAGPEQAEGRHEQPGRPSWERGATPPGGCGRL